jgi:hypothetical protein
MLQTGNRAYLGRVAAPPGERTDPREVSEVERSSRYKVSQRNAWLPPVTPQMSAVDGDRGGLLAAAPSGYGSSSGRQMRYLRDVSRR